MYGVCDIITPKSFLPCDNIDLRGRCERSSADKQRRCTREHVLRMGSRTGEGGRPNDCGSGRSTENEISFEVSHTGLRGGAGHRDENRTSSRVVAPRTVSLYFTYRENEKEGKKKTRARTHACTRITRDAEELHLLPRGHRSRRTERKTVPCARPLATVGRSHGPLRVRVHRNYNPCRPTVMT